MITKAILDRYKDYTHIAKWWWIYIHHSVFEKYMKDIIDNGHYIIWYDGMIVTDEATMWPIDLVFYFTENGSTPEIMNKLAMESVHEFDKRVDLGGYNQKDLYIDVIYDKVENFKKNRNQWNMLSRKEKWFLEKIKTWFH